MALNLTSQPGQSDPIPISDCLRWVFQADDADIVTTPGVQAELVIVFPSSPSDPGNGTEFILWGFVMTTDDSVPYTATSFEVVAGDDLQTMNNFASMIAANFYFSRAVTIDIDEGSNTVTLTWNDCGEQENFGSEQMEFSGIIGSAITSATPANGTTPVYVSGYRIQYRMWRIDINDGSNSGPIMAYEGMTPNLLCTTSEESEFDGMPTARELLHTPLPELDDSHPDVNYNEIIQYFTLEYGWTYRDENCQALSGDFAFSLRPSVWNAYFQPEDVYRVRKYWPGAAGGLPAGQTYVKFLTTQPDAMEVYEDTKCWLWYMVNESVQNWVELRLRIVAQKKDGSGVTSSVIVTNSGYGINAVNVSPSYILSLGLAGVDETTLDLYQVHITTQNSGNPLDLTQITETKTYVFKSGGCGSGNFTDMYFLTPIGGIGTIPVEIIQKNAEQTGNEILLNVPCTASRADKGRYGGRTLSNLRSYESFTFRSRSSETEINEFFKDLKLSPQRWIRRQAEDGTWIARKLIVEPGGVKIYEDGPKVTVEVNGYLGDIQIQSITEPTI